VGGGSDRRSLSCGSSFSLGDLEHLHRRAGPGDHQSPMSTKSREFIWRGAFIGAKMRAKTGSRVGTSSTAMMWTARNQGQAIFLASHFTHSADRTSASRRNHRVRSLEQEAPKGGNMIKLTVCISAFAIMGAATSATPTTLKQEPPMGAMREGQVVLVDDGSCPAGQIKRVVGGNHTKAGGTKQIVRTSSCVGR
jgi:hypothetical protein